MQDMWLLTQLRRRNDMDMSFVFLAAMGFLTFAMVAGLFQTVTAVVRRRASRKPTRR